VPLVPLAASFEQEQQSAKLNDIVFRQDLAVPYVIELEDHLETSVYHDLTIPGTMSFQNGEQLYPVILKSDAELKVYCSFNFLENAKGYYGRGCLSDSDSDGKLDLAWYLREPAKPAPIGGGDMVSAAVPLPAPIAYHRVDSALPPTISFAVKYQRYNTFQHVFRLLIEGDNGQYYPFTWLTYDLPKDNLPAIVDVAGMKIRVVSNSGNEISYQIVSGLPEDTLVYYVRRASSVWNMYY
tara:strand:- start:478 stop:1194 length:717 start_codon:yes stop_codon:yes gene_type:complete